MPLDFNASGLNHSKPKGTLDFVSPEQLLFAFDAQDGAQSVVVGPMSGQFLQVQWTNVAYKPPGGTVVGEWGNGIYIGAGTAADPVKFGAPTVVSDRLVSNTGWLSAQFGSTQVRFDDQYVYPVVRVNASWQGSQAYSAPTGSLTGSWSAIVQVYPLGIAATTQFGNSTFVDEKFIAPVGMANTQFGSSYALRWFEYAPAWSPVNASWLGKNTYTPAVSSLNVAWLPPVNAQTIGPVSFSSTQFGNASLPKVVRPTAIGSTTAFGTPTLDLLGCSNFAFNGTGNEVPIRFGELRDTYTGDQVPVQFACESGGVEYTYFSDYINAYAGETSAFDIASSFKFDFVDGGTVEFTDLDVPDYVLSTQFYSGEETYIDLDTSKLFTFEMYSGEVMVGGGNGCSPVVGFRNVGGSENAAPNLALSSFRLQNPGSGTSGSVIGLDAVDTSQMEKLVYEWTQNMSGGYYDNDDTDAAFHFGFIFNRARTSITTLTQTWEYDTPYIGYSYAPNAPWLRTWLPFSSNQVTGYQQFSPTQGNYTHVNYTKALGVNLFVAMPMRAELIKEPSGKVRQKIYANGILLSEQLTTLDWPSTVVPVWYYRNYAHSGSYIDITGVQQCGDEFLTVPPSPYIPGPVFADGAEASLALALTQTFPLNVYEDATANADLSTYPAALLELAANDGAAAEASLSTVSRLEVEFGEGASFLADLAANPSAEILLTAQEGASASFDLSLAIQLGLAALYDGARADVSLDTLENYQVFDGSYVQASLATEQNVEILAFTGEESTILLSDYPSENIGTFRGYEGASVAVALGTLPQVQLFPNTISAAEEFHYDILGYMGVDLLNTSCCPIKESHELIMLERGPAADERYDGDKVVMTMDLSTLQRFKFDFHDGTNFRAIDPNYFSFNFTVDVGAANISTFDQDEYNFNLCKGNFIPDGDAVVVELINTDLNNCESIAIYDGASAKLDLSTIQGPTVLQDAGEHVDVILTIDPALRLCFWEGAEFRWPVVYLELDFRADGEFALTFDEEAYIAYEGATMTIDKLTTEYEVEFLESGCLDNEFVPMDENGDADMDKFNPVPVELEFFTHSIRAKCF